MKRLIAYALLAALPTLLFAQPPAGPGGGERRAKMHEAVKDAHKACEGKQGPERRDCMRREMCAKAPDRAQCEARAREREQRRSERLDERQKAHEACTGKRGEELRNCLREQHPKKPAPKS
jgi:hypothetical protein